MSERNDYYGYENAAKAVGIIRKHLGQQGFNPDSVNDGVILGSGLGNFANEYLDASHANDNSGPVSFAFDEIYTELKIPLVEGQVPGHDRKLIIGPLKGSSEGLIIAQSGREHPYEGVDTRRATFWLRVMQLLGVKTLLASNASGILTPEQLKPTDLMLVTGDQDFAANVDSPLLGPNDEKFGPCFPHMGDLYTASTTALAREKATQLGVPLKEGTYMRVKGPTYERAEDVYRLRAELEGIWHMGANQSGENRFSRKARGLRDWLKFLSGRSASEPTGVVGMSTTYEMAVAQHASQSESYPAFLQGKGAISVATNYAAALGVQGFAAFPSHTEVKENAAKVEENFGKLVQGILLSHQRNRAK